MSAFDLSQSIITTGTVNKIINWICTTKTRTKRKQVKIQGNVYFYEV